MKLKLSSFLSLLTFGIILMATTGCLVLRSQMDPSAPANPQKYRQSSDTVRLQQEKAELEMKLKSYDEQFRTLLGRIEEMESKTSKENPEDQQRVKDLEAALSEMVAQQEALKKEISNLKKNDNNSSSAASGPTGDLTLADRYFSTGKWTKAVEEFQKFRELNPKSSEVPLVTYKIGVCFQELGMKGEAKTFYNSVIKRYPKDRAAKFAKFRLDSL